MSKGGATLRRFCYLRVTVWGCGAQQTEDDSAAGLVAAGATEVVVPFIMSASPCLPKGCSENYSDGPVNF